MKWLLLQLLIFFHFLAVAGEYSHIFRHYQIKDGLSDNLVTGFLQDRHGFIWIGTRDGLNKFDGYTFKTYRITGLTDELRNSNRINHINSDKNGDIWISTRLGLYKYDEKRDSFDLLPSTQGKNIASFDFDFGNRLWRLENGKLIRHNVSNDTYQIYSHKDGLSFLAFCIGFDDHLWVSDTQGYLSLLNQENGGFTSYNMFPDESSDISKRIYQLYPSKYSSEIYMAYESDNLKVFCASALSHKNLDIQEVNNAHILINCILEINANEIWIGTDAGIFMYKKDSGKWTTIRPDPLDPYSISSHYVAELYQDCENGIWIGYHQNGLSYYSSFNPFNVYYPKNKSIKGGVVHDISADDYGTLWIATEDAGLSSFNRNTGKFTNYYSESGQHNIAHTNIRGLAVVKDKLWVGHVICGVDLLDVKTGKRIKNYNLYKDAGTRVNSRVTTMLALKNGDLLVATPDGLYRYDTSSDKFVLLLKMSIGMLREDGHNRLWIGSYYCDLSDESGSELIFKKLEIPVLGINRYNISDVFADEYGNIWFLIDEKGIIKYRSDNKQITWLTTANGMPSNVTFRILPDDNGHLWVSTAAGLVCINRSDNSITTYTEAHGLITRQFNYHAGFKDEDGSFYFGTVKGLVHFDPHKLNPNRAEADVFITSIHLSGGEEISGFGEHISGKQRLELNYNQSTFNVNFSTLSYVAPGSTQYAYRMVGINEKWNVIGTRNFIHFADLHPGKYTLEIKASDILGNWSYSVPLTLHLIISPPWWTSTTANIIYLLLVLGMIYLATRFWLLRQKKSMIYEMQLFESRKERELYQTKIDFFLNITHEIRTPLTLIKIPLERIINYGKICNQGKKSLILMEKNVSRLIELVNQLLDFRKAETEDGNMIYMNVEIIALIEAVACRFRDAANEKKISLSLDLFVENLNVFIDKEAFTKVLSNLFFNAIKYSSGSIVVSLRISDDKQNFMLDFMNDGKPIPKEFHEKIFEPFYRMNEDRLKPGTGLGLPLTRFLVEKHHGTIRVVESTEGKTIFRVIMPVKQSNVVESIPEDQSSIIPVAHDYPYVVNRSTLLVVEDNEELRLLISSELSNRYNVIAVGNGREALHELKNNNIQLIISDILMPVMDGFELLKEIKTNLEFSHIPVILLTAKTTIQARLEGLESGADAYIGKPFSMDLLLAQISNLLTNRENIRQFYFKSPIVNMKSMAYSKADEEFLEKLNTIINEHLNKPDFDVNTIACILCMSRPTLYRKINAISSLTPHDLIKIARLKKAAELLIQGELRIYEISELVGFSSQSYFWSAFIKQFGMSPSKYAKMNKMK